jgi:glycosyltransferase involved in cell wall biosynthesis
MPKKQYWSISMGKKRILVLTEMSFQGSGYYYLMSPILEGLSKDYEIKVIGLSYDESEHHFGFSITGCKSLQDSVAIAQNIIKMWTPDLFICGLDIPLQTTIFDALKPLGVKYVAVTPLENPPLTQTWAAQLMQMNFVFFISELGKQAALKAGMKNVDHLLVGADTKTFYPADTEERNKIREDLGVSNEFVILTVADNQERKNIWAEFEIISKLKKDGMKVKFILVTREHSPVGNKLRDLALDYDLNKELVIIERGIGVVQLRSLYVAADVYLSTSKAEGLGIPILEAMACGTPVVATDTGAITELLDEHRGFLIGYEYEFRDVWGNSIRRMIDTDGAFKTISIIKDSNGAATVNVRKDALEYVKARTFDIPTQQMKEKIEELTNE